MPGRNLFFLHREETSASGGRKLEAFRRLLPTRWCGNGCPHVRPHPGLTNLEFGRVFTFCARTLSAYLVEKNRGCEPRVKKLQPTCADRAANPDLPII